jgi:2-hydroxy-3-oxopropionate reductase
LAEGAHVTEAVRGADVVLTVLPDFPYVEQVVLGEEGVLARAAASATQ